MNHFITAFETELVKQAGHPLLQTVAKGGTLLGQKVKGMVTRVTDRAGKISKKTRKKMKKKASEDDLIQSILTGAEGSSDAIDKEMPGAEDTRYGGGLGNLGKKKAPKFTNKVNPTDMPAAFGTGSGCDPKHGCGKGMHGTGCGMAKKAGFWDTVRGMAAPPQASKNDDLLRRRDELVKKRQQIRGERAVKDTGAAAAKMLSQGAASALGGLKQTGKAMGFGGGGGKQRGKPIVETTTDPNALSMGLADFKRAKTPAKAPASTPKKKSSPAEITMAPDVVQDKGKFVPTAREGRRLARKPEVSVGEAPKRVASGRPTSSSLGGPAGGGLPGALTPSFMGGGGLPQRASMASFGGKPGFGEAGKLRAPTMPGSSSRPGGSSMVAGAMPPKEDTTAPKRRTNLMTGKPEAG